MERGDKELNMKTIPSLPSIFLADLTYTTSVVSLDHFPLSTGYVAAYASSQAFYERLKIITGGGSWGTISCLSK
jgi:hypothetical protein